MSQLPTTSFFDDQLLAGPRPIDLMSPGERLELRLKQNLGPKIDAETEALADSLGPLGTGLVSSWTGKLGAKANAIFQGFTSDDEAYATPLNFDSKEVKKFDTFGSKTYTLDDLGVGQWHLKSQRNNVEGITEDLMNIDPAAHSWLLSSSSYGEYLDRLDMARISSPEFASKANFAGRAIGFTADAAAIITSSMALEPLAFVGYGQRFIKSGQAIAGLRSTERFGSMYRISEEAAEAATMISRMSGIGRYATLGIAEEAAIKAGRYGVDPTYDPDAASLITDTAVSMAFGGLIGGFAARSYASSRIAEHAENFYHQSRIGNGLILNHHTPLAFVSTAAADRTLLGRNVMPVGETVDGLADEAWESYSRTGREFVPGTESMSLPVMQGEGSINRVEDVGAALLRGDRGMASFGPSFYTPANENLLMTLLNEGRSGGWRGLRAAASKVVPARGEFARSVRRLVGAPERLRPSGVVLSNRRGARLSGALAEDTLEARTFYPGGQGLGQGIEISFDSTTLRGEFMPEGRSLFEGAAEGDAVFRYGGNWRNLQRSIQSVTISPSADPTEAIRIKEVLIARGWVQRTLKDGTTVFTPTSRPRFRATNEEWRGAVTGIQSSILNILAEIQRKGGQVNQDLARTVARTLFATHAQRIDGTTFAKPLSGAAFESKVWDNLSEFLDPAVAEKIAEARRRGNVQTIGRLDTAFDELVERRETIDGLWAHFDIDPDIPPEIGITSAPIGQSQNASLILQVANEIRFRGGEVSRETFEEVIEDLRSLMQNPPMRRNSRGKMVLDSRARLAQVAEVINRRVPAGGRKVSVPRSLENTVKSFGNRLDTSRKAAVAAEAARLKAGAPTVPGAFPATATSEVSTEAVEAGAETVEATAAKTVDAMRQMQEEIPLLDKFDVLGPIARFFNQAAVGLRLSNPSARLAFSIAFNARRAMQTASGVRVAQGQTVFERGTYEMTGYLATGLTAYRNGYTRFALGRGKGDKISLMDGLRAGFGRGSRQKIDEFNRAIMEQLRTGAYNHANESVNETARQLRKMLNDMHTAANQARVRGFQTSAVQNYVPRLWRWDRISRLGTTAEGRAALKSLLENALAQQTGLRRVVLEDGSMVDLPDVAQAAEVLTERLIRLSQNSDLAPLLDIDVEVSKALNGLLAPLSGSGASRTPFGRTRIIMDELADHKTASDLLGTGRNGVSIADLTVDDLPTLIKKYTISVFGAINERRFIDNYNDQLAHFGIRDANGKPLALETIAEVKATINRLGNTDVAAFGGEMQGEAADAFDEIIAALRYEPLHRSNQQLGSLGRWGDKITNVILPLGYMSTGGMFGLVAAAETSRIIGTLGLRTTLRQVPLLAEMVENWRNMDEGPRNLAGLLDQAFHPSTDRLRRTLMMQVQNQYGPTGNVIERGLSSAANFFSDVSLLAPVTSFTQHLMTASTLQHLYEVSKGMTKRMDDATIRTLGLEPNQYDEIVDYVGTNAVTAARGASNRVVDLNNLNDLRMDNLKVFLDRAVRTRIQDMPTRGDFHRIGFTFLGRLLTQFRGFNLKGVDNFALQNLSRIRRGDAATKLRVAQEIAFTMVFASLVQYSRNYMDVQSLEASGQDEKAKETADRLLGVSGFVRGGFTGPSEFFLPIFAVDGAWNTFISDDPLFSAYRYSGLNWYGFPAASFVAKSLDVTEDVFGRAVAKPLGLEDKERDITQATVHKARLLIPFQNFLPVKHFFNLAESEIAKEFQLLERQPRRKRNED